MSFDPRDVVERMSYKDGCAITLEPPRWAYGPDAGSGPFDTAWQLTLVRRVEDTHNPGHYAPQYFSTQVLHEMLRTERDVVMAVGHALRQLEMHELDEWFRLDGELVRDPHAATPRFPG